MEKQEQLQEILGKFVDNFQINDNKTLTIKAVHIHATISQIEWLYSPSNPNNMKEFANTAITSGGKYASMSTDEKLAACRAMVARINSLINT